MWCLGSQRCFSSFHSNIGNCRTQRKRQSCTFPDFPSRPFFSSSASPSCVRSTPSALHVRSRSEERRVGKSVDLGGRRILKKKKNRTQRYTASSTRRKGYE